MSIHCPTRRAGFTIAEALAATVITTIACSAMLLALAQSIQSSDAGVDTTRANLLAADLMNEISASRWADAAQPNYWGPESGETDKQNTRAAFNDLDDYDGWSGPPQSRDGMTLDSLQGKYFAAVQTHPYAGYVSSVRVEPMTANGQSLAAGTASPYRRVTVTVSRPRLATHKISRTFQDTSPLLGSQHWYSPNANEPLANVQWVP